MKINHVPSLGLRYWVALSLASVFGANMGDFVAHILGWGHAFGLAPLAALFAVILVMEQKSNFSSEIYYWLGIVTLRTAATNLSDLANHDMRFNPETVMIVLAIGLGLVLLLWRPADKRQAAPPTVDQPPLDRQPGDRPEEQPSLRLTVDARYWTAMLIAGVLGTAMGDFAADDLGLGLGSAAVSTVCVLAAALLLQYLRGWNAGPYYWLTIVIIRTAGTNVGDLLASRHGFKLGLPVSTPLTGLALLLVLLIWQDKTVTATRNLYLSWAGKPGLGQAPDAAVEETAPSAVRGRSVSWAPVVLASIGWLLFCVSLAYSALQQNQEQSLALHLQDQNQKLAAELQQQQVAAGAASDIAARQATAQAALEATQRAALDAEQALHDVEARTAQDHAAAVNAAAQDAIKSVREAEEQASQQRDAALKATADAKAEHDRLMTEAASAQQNLKALQQNAVSLSDAIALLKTRHAYLEQQAADLQGIIAGLSTTRDEAAKAVDEANIERDRIAGEAVSLREENTALQAQVAATKADVAAGATKLANLQDQFQTSRKNLAEQINLLKQMTTARDVIAQQIAQRRIDLARLGVASEKPLASLEGMRQGADAAGQGAQLADAPVAIVKKPEPVGETHASRDTSMCFNWETHAPCKIDQ